MDILDITDVADGMREQAEHCRKNDAPVTAAIICAQIPLMDGETKCGQRIANWPGKPLEDAMPLRLTGGLHHLHLNGQEPRLAQIYDGTVTEQIEIDTIIADVVAEHDDKLLPWFESPPQTNEAGRSANFMAGMLWLSDKIGPRVELLEIGASGGVNTMMAHYHYDLGGTRAGPADSPMQITPEWRGPPPPSNPVEILSAKACDQNPIDLTDDETAQRLMGYIWPEMPERFERMEAAIKLARQSPPDLVKADAADWAEEQLVLPQTPGVTRVLMHSIVWQYLPPETKKRIETAMDAAASRAAPDKPLAWISSETNRKTFRHDLIVRFWNGGPNDGQNDGSPVKLGHSHAHGAWVQWLEGEA